MIALADGSEVLHHLMADLLVKGLIVVGAVLVVIVGVVVIWKKVGR
ncbi:hypothetical protein [Amycolatopsis jejuensis]|nr:hypothetical protein [Amycolatopsis jejuensis]